MKKLFLFLILCFVVVMEGKGQQGYYVSVKLVQYHTPNSDPVYNFRINTPINPAGQWWWNGGQQGWWNGGAGCAPTTCCWGLTASPGFHNHIETIFTGYVPSTFNITMRSFTNYGAGTTCTACQGNAGSCNNSNEFKTERYTDGAPLDLFSHLPDTDIDYIINSDNGQGDGGGGGSNGGGFEARFKIRYYTPPSPNITLSSNNFCPDDNLTLTASSPAGVNPAMYQGLSYQWSYSLESSLVTDPNYSNCVSLCGNILDGVNPSDADYSDLLAIYNNCIANCDATHPPIQQDSWQSISGASYQGASITFKPSDVFVSSTPFDATRTVKFRCRVYSPTNSSVISHQSIPFIGNLLALSPKFSSNPSDLIITPSCPNDATGKIQIKNVNKITSGNYYYVLRSGHSNSEPVNPTSAIFPEEGAILSGISSNPIDFTITNRLAGNYTLLIANGGGTQGACYSWTNITIPAYPELKLPITPLDAVTKTDISCFGGTDGSIMSNAEGGKPAPALITQRLFNASNTQVGTSQTGASVTFGGLLAGKYKIEVKDECNQMVEREITILQPPITNATLSQITQPTCNNPSNGAVTIVENTETPTTTNFLLPRSDNVAYEVWRNGVLDNTLSNASFSLPASREIMLTNLSAGNYEVKIRNQATPVACVGGAKTLTFAIDAENAIPAPTHNTPQNVKCKNGTDGSFIVSNFNGAYSYTLHKITENIFVPMASGEVTNLKAGQYRVIAKRQGQASCLDQALSEIITIIEPPLLTIPTASKTDITCFAEGNGKIEGTIAGGTPPYTRFLEVPSGSNWVVAQTENNTTSPFIVNNLDLGTYRIRIKDSKDCEISSQSFVIQEPSLLQINTPTREDIKCFGEMGKITINATGGTLPYTHEYTTDGTNYVVFNNNTPLPAGSYMVRVKDARGCTKPFTPLIITTPSQALDFTHSNSNGYRINCHGANTGFVNLNVTGGNGASYTGYTYSLNGNTFAPVVPTISELVAGNYTLRVRDGRGCEVTKNFELTQPTGSLSATTSNIQNLACPTIPTGSFQVNAQQGTPPYQYSKDNGVTFQSSAIFGALFIGTYPVVVKDANDCRTTTSVTIGSIFPLIAINHTQTNISCFGGSNGSIAVAPTGGNGTYTYAWQGRNETTPTISGLVKGTYKVTVTDGTGCNEVKEIVLTEPSAPLKLTQKTAPVCFGQTNGSITFSCTGGTAPYQYSIDGGNTYSINPVFAVAAGTYNLKVRDANVICTDTGITVVETRNTLPVPNFLISTRTNALDTLLIKEISVPKPDTLFWEFPAGATVIDANPWAPLIKFPAQGIYAVKMTGEFAGCFYSITKNLDIKPYDPNATNVLPTGTRMLKSLLVSPNPNDGNFNYKIEVAKKRKVVVTLLNTLGNTIYSKEIDNQMLIDETVSLPNVPSGLYILRVVTDIDARQQTISITK